MNGVNLLEWHDWTFPVPIAYGPGRLKEIGALCANVGVTRPLVMTDRGSSDLPFIADAGRYLQESGLSFDLFSDVSPNPRDDEIAAGRAVFREGGHDGIVAIGGGSGMDGGKAVGLVAANDFDLWAFDFDKPPPDMTDQSPFPPLICVPTTAGTGAETESTAMVTETARVLKLCVWHPGMKPVAALLDPEITLALPMKLTAWTGCDAMVHAIEAYCARPFHPMCDGIALEGLRLIGASLPTAVRNGEDLEARGGMLLGSCLAGVSFLKGLGLVHAISHMVGAEYDTHHGLTNAVVLPAVLRFNAPEIAEKISPMAAALGLADESFDGFYHAVVALLDELEIPVKLTDIGVPAESAAALAQKASQDAAAETNPRPATVAEIESVIDDALTKGR